ncbi:hypothetical protein SAMN05421678_108250 [Actinopolymorpha cephalotaxi]|uniref:dTDP-4-dehydrorhamnose 3,5-epimerase-like enzyme n=1 Tax=Actinopolymorpha cephalotaxi TaxID=504797 RepID=A0A1I2UNB9_9ACTN|nr:hypothetical protein [Actinopolymorpha cephalotaxi]NYH86664.1 dTDP-4-dehydrorhamnose 3,5-epimerase-like enzyme [Actinopolymorpha cephalotaxi]SFG78538.1 hypothetical protein SAMN05421678_108250 [Actinopolymorpha cephalotaxi]
MTATAAPRAEVLASFDDLQRAEAALHQAAGWLRGLHLSKRYGVKLQHREGAVWLVLVDRTPGVPNPRREAHHA